MYLLIFENGEISKTEELTNVIMEEFSTGVVDMKK